MTQTLQENRQEKSNTENEWYFRTITYQNCFEIVEKIFPKIYKNNLVVKTEFYITGLEFFEIIIKLIEKHLYNEKFLIKKQQLIAEKLEEIAKEEKALSAEKVKAKGTKKKKK